MMRLVLALDSFKGSLSAHDAQIALARGLTANNARDFAIDIEHLPISDGGEGFLHAICTATNNAISHALAPTTSTASTSMAHAISHPSTSPLATSPLATRTNTHHPHANHTATSYIAHPTTISPIITATAAINQNATANSHPSLHNDIAWQLASTRAHAPYGNIIEASYLYHGDFAIIEMAQSSALTLTPISERRTLYASSYGFGEVIRRAYARGARRFILSIGGSASTDGGMGLLQALGVRFYDEGGKLIKKCASGKDLAKVARIVDFALIEKLRACEIVIACDVSNPLLGKHGASYVYARQKGVQEGDIEYLEASMKIYRDAVFSHMGMPIVESSGDGAAGGVGFALRVFLGAKMQSGIDVFFSLTQARKRIQNSDMVITGEGNIDAQSAFGKAISGVARIAKEEGIPCIAVAGGLGEGYEALHKHHIQAMFAITNAPMSVEYAMAHAEALLEQLGRQIASILRIGASSNSKK